MYVFKFKTLKEIGLKSQNWIDAVGIILFFSLPLLQLVQRLEQLSPFANVMLSKNLQSVFIQF
jgi:hypothetical protein